MADAAPLALCELHYAVAGDWNARSSGLVDALPAPCRLCGSSLGVRFPSGWLCAECEWRHGDIVDAELAPPRLDIVYYLRYADRVKIGTTANPRQRLAAIMHEEVLAFERGDRMLERRRHAQFALERYERTEWFRLSDRILEHVDALRGGTADPWAALARWRSRAAAATLT
ncbi:T5orf172 domain-containing protein [Microbacterium pygmaeum]|uniref:T5orf172 domain-containing protein n=1 Tax=Microbacterium pygmaeum TaxID=370764 RepID=A0A1G7TVK9_9MICO|nr:T5orf172 domain-containing protein [Microbacterium pygmaeum]